MTRPLIEFVVYERIMAERQEKVARAEYIDGVLARSGVRVAVTPLGMEWRTAEDAGMVAYG